MLQDFFLNVADILIPDFMNVVISFPETNVMAWAFNEKGCFAYNGVKLLNVVDAYQCGPLFRIQCWLEVLGIQYEMTPEVKGCVMANADRCNGRFYLLSLPAPG